MPDENTSPVSPQTSLAITDGQMPANPRLPPAQQQDLSAPDIGAPALPQQAPALAPTRQPSAKDAVDAHHSMIGRIASALLGKQVDYRINEAGQQEAYEVPQRPGDLFRHILAGALIGGAAAKGTNSVLAGFSRGGAASIGASREADQQRQQRAQQDFANKQVVDKAAQEKLQSAATHEHWNKEQLLHERAANLRDT